MTETWSDPAFAAVARFVTRRLGLSFESARQAEAEAGIRRAMVRADVPDVARYGELLEAGRIPLDDLVTELTVGETYFFREPAHFEFIRQVIVPDVLDRRGADHSLRVWSAGCATGEEPYSLAVVLDEAGVRGQILATDISRSALERAREAAYRRWALRGLDAERIDRLFRRAGDRWHLLPRYREAVTFRFHNLAQDAYPSWPAGIWGMDLIVCRNVLIYFDRHSIARVARGLHDSLADGGWLITGPSDPPLDPFAPVVPVVTGAGVFYRKEDGRPGARAIAMPVEHHPPAAEPIGEELPLQAPSIASAHPPFAAPPRPAEPLDSSLPTPALHVAEADPLAEARRALAAGEYERVLALAHDDDPAAAVLHIRALANARGSAEAARQAQRAVKRHPLSTELHLLQALLLVDMRRYAEAEQALRRVLYLDRSLAVANYLLGLTLREQGKVHAARRAYCNARDLARGRPPQEELPFADGGRAAALAMLVEADLALLETRGGGS